MPTKAHMYRALIDYMCEDLCFRGLGPWSTGRSEVRPSWVSIMVVRIPFRFGIECHGCCNHLHWVGKEAQRYWLHRSVSIWYKRYRKTFWEGSLLFDACTTWWKLHMWYARWACHTVITPMIRASRPKITFIMVPLESTGTGDRTEPVVYV